MRSGPTSLPLGLLRASRFWLFPLKLDLQPPAVGCRWRLGGWGWITGVRGPVGLDFAKATGTSSRPDTCLGRRYPCRAGVRSSSGGWDTQIPCDHTLCCTPALADSQCRHHLACAEVNGLRRLRNLAGGEMAPPGPSSTLRESPPADM